MLRRTRFAFFIAILFTISLTGCSKKDDPKTTTTTTTTTDDKNTKPLSGEVITQDKQKQLTADIVIQSLKDGNKRFVDGKLTGRDYAKQIKETGHGQYPEAVVLSCIDSRIPVEIVFDRGIGDLFVARVAGNIENGDILGSMEYSCKVVGAKLVLVMGHNHCGAVKSAVDDVKLGNITGLLAKIKPSVESFTDYHGEKTSKNDEFVDMVAKKNVMETIAEIRKNSPVLKEMEDKGEIKFAGAIYNVETGKVEFIEK